MKLRTLWLLLALIAANTTVSALEPVPLPEWLHGAWAEKRDGQKWADEFWTPPRGGIMMGAARMGDGERLSLFEHTRIVRQPDGQLHFIAQPFGKPPSPFPMVASGNQMIEFANPAHDYPQRIRYWRDGNNLHARISLMDGSKAIEWRYQPMGSAAD